MADAQPKASKDRHPEISAPILDLSLEAKIARAEQRVVDRDARLREGAAQIAATLRSKRGEAVRWAALGAGAAALGAIAYGGWRAWRGRASIHREVHGDSPRPSAAEPGFVVEAASFARIAAQWAVRLHREQGVVGSLFGMARRALWPSAAPLPGTAPSASAPHTDSPLTEHGADPPIGA